MTSMNKYIFRERESKLIEFKEKIPKFEVLIKTCVAFANASGGRIIIGVKDANHEVVGVTDSDRTRIYDDFPKSLYESTHPSLIPQIYEQNFGNDSVLIIDIPNSPRKPYFIKSAGMQNGTYIRVGSSTRKATPEYIQDLMREAERINYDEELIPAQTTILSKELLAEFFQITPTKKRLLAEKIIAQKPANHDQYCPTVAGTLMFSEEPQKYINEALILCTRFRGTSGRDIINTEDITGTIEQQAAGSLSVIMNWLTTHYELKNIKLENKTPIPAEVIRESVLNALLHRKYSIPGAIKIAIYDDRLEIFSPGCFPGLVDINTLGDGTTYLRNPLLVRFAYQMHLIETRGTGIRLIFDSCKKAGLKKPEYHEDADFVKLIIFLTPDIESFSDDSQAILMLLQNQMNLSSQQVADYLSISRNTAIRKLDALIKKKKIIKVGKGPMVRYKLK